MERREFETIGEIREYLKVSTDFSGAVFQDIDLNAIADELKGATLENNILLGCSLSGENTRLFHNAIHFPVLPDVPFKPFRSSLYTPEELLGDYEIGNPSSYEKTVDSAAYKHYLESGKAQSQDVVVTLARRLHDHAISDALQEYLNDKKPVAIMGGHSMRRDDSMYLQVARLSRDLVNEGYLPTSGGGPGAMEATHLGAWFAERTDDELVEAISILSAAPLYKPKDKWMDVAFEVREKYPLPIDSTSRSLGIPTWMYGHEPPSCFATDIAKYFANSVREEGLLAIATYGIIFAPGSAGTIQEIFQDATQNHYKSFDIASPMIFLGEAYWKWSKPVFHLLAQLAAGHEYSSLLYINDSSEKILDRINKFKINEVDDN